MSSQEGQRFLLAKSAFLMTIIKTVADAQTETLQINLIGRITDYSTFLSSELISIFSKIALLGLLCKGVSYSGAEIKERVQLAVAIKPYLLSNNESIRIASIQLIERCCSSSPAVMDAFLSLDIAGKRTLPEVDVHHITKLLLEFLLESLNGAPKAMQIWSVFQCLNSLADRPAFIKHAYYGKL